MFGVQTLVATACLLGSALGQTKLKIMPLGDSITEITCWRPIVWDNLVAANLGSQIQFVGSMTNNPQNCVGKTSTWDKHHEGHSGYLAVNIANTNLAGWLSSAKPDIVMFMLGTNDVNSYGTADIIAAYTKMVGLMRSSNQGMKIIVDLPIPFPAVDAKIKSLVAAIPAWAASQNTTASPIYIADCNTGYNGQTMLRDGVHPNAAGDALIAQRVSPVLINAVKKSLGVAMVEREWMG
ncbi:cellulose-binding protein [Cadophora sp. MPI-SDFR-AT-0126]|nr:cellulose-binding protein [Leotiomycetes sp. MPI-SDFR-AT-0126]